LPWAKRRKNGRGQVGKVRRGSRAGGKEEEKEFRLRREGGEVYTSVPEWPFKPRQRFGRGEKKPYSDGVNFTTGNGEWSLRENGGGGERRATGRKGEISGR